MFLVQKHYLSSSLSVSKALVSMYDVIAVPCLMLVIQMVNNIVFKSLLVCYESAYLLIQKRYEDNVSLCCFHAKADNVTCCQI